MKRGSTNIVYGSNVLYPLMNPCVYDPSVATTDWRTTLNYAHKRCHSRHLTEYNSNKKTKQKNRKRNIIWFNPPYSKNVVTKVGHYFLKLLDKHFPRHHKLHKIFNRNTVKVSYSCTKNIKSIINCHNKKVLHQSRPCPNER